MNEIKLLLEMIIEKNNKTHPIVIDDESQIVEDFGINAVDSYKRGGG